MIPEAYWKLIWHWWWLMGLFLLLGAGGAYAFSRSLHTYESQAVLEVTRVYSPDGSVSYDDFARRLEANRWAQELRGLWVATQLKSALASQEIEVVSTLDLMSFTVPSVARDRVGPATMVIAVRHRDPRQVLAITKAASKLYAEYINGRQEEFLNQRREEAKVQFHRSEEELRGVLEAKSRALSLESEKVSGEAQSILSANERLLGQLPLLLDDFRRQIGLSNVGLGAETRDLDDSLGALRAEVENLRSEWQSRLRPSLSVLYAAESQPDFQLALSKEKPSRTRYEELTRLLSMLQGSGSGKVVEVLQDSTSPQLVSALGFRTRYLMVFGGAGGLLVGWTLANLGEYLLLMRAGRRGAGRQHADVSPGEPRPSAA